MIENINDYIALHSSPEPQLLQALITATQNTLPNPGMLCGRVEGRFLRLLVSLLSAKRVLELGTFSGYSALSMAEALPADGYLLSCDHNETALQLAREYIAKSEHAHKIHIAQQEILDLLQTLKANGEHFDFIFIDANKKQNAQYVDIALTLLAPRGMIAIDNTLWKGEVLSPQDSISRGIADLNDDLVARQDIDVLLLPLRDGVTLIRKK